MLGALIGVWFAALWAAFSAWGAADGWAFPRFVAATVFLVALPGRQILRWTVGDVGSRAEEAMLSLSLGALAAVGLYWVLLRSGIVEWFWLWPLATGIATFWEWPSLVAWAKGFARRPSRVEAALLGVATVTCLLLGVVPLYYRNLSLDVAGRLSFYPFADVVLHLAAAQELTHNAQPQVPFVPGLPLRYHYGMDLLVAFYARIGRLDVADVCVRFVPTLYAGLLALSAFCFGRRWLGWSAGGVLVALLVSVGEDLSFIPGLLRGGAPDVWASYYFGWPSVISLYLMNPMGPALAFSLAALVCVHRWEASARGGWRWLVLGGALLATVGAHKAFLLAHLLLGLLAAGVFLAVRGKGGRFLRGALLLGLISMPLGVALVGAGRGSASVELHHRPYVATALGRCGLWETWLGRQIEGFLSSDGSLLGGCLYGLVAVPAFLVATGGLRVLGVRRLLAALAGRDGVSATLGVVVVSGPILALTLAITPTGYEVRQSYNEAVWFAVQAKHLMWFFAVAQLRRFGLGSTVRWGLVAALVAVTALPSTADYFIHQAHQFPLPRLGPEILDVVHTLQRRAQPGDVVLAPGDSCKILVALAPLRSPCFSVHPRYFIGPSQLATDQESLARFWQGIRERRLDEDTLDRFGARWLVTGAEGVGRSHPRLVESYRRSGIVVFEVRPRTSEGAAASRAWTGAAEPLS